jgi:hypothetical protein
MNDHKKRAIIYLVWGEQFIRQVVASIASIQIVHCYPVFIITDKHTSIDCDLLNVNVIRVDFKLNGYLRKCEMINHLPPNYDSYLFLDSDTIVLEDISLGFEKAEKFGIAIAAAPHYSLDHFLRFKEVMVREGCELKGQLQYNTGVIFFALKHQVVEVFRLWYTFARKYQHLKNDQPFFTLAMEHLGFNPYTLSRGYNYRHFGEIISGIVRIWHSHREMPENINIFDRAWPPRRVENGKVILPSRRTK